MQIVTNYINNTKDFFNSFRNEKGRQTYRRIGSITFPAFVELFLNSIFGVINLVMVGRLSTEAIAGVGLTNQPLFLLMAIFAAVNVGTTTLVSWNIGKNNFKQASFITKQAIMFNVILGVVVMLIGYFGARFFIPLLIDDDIVINYAVGYFQIISLGIAFMTVSMGISAALRGAGITKIPMIYNICASLLNVTLNYLLIYGNFGFPELGINGAALATTISRGISCTIAILVLVFWKSSPIRLKIRTSWLPHLKTLKDIFRIGMPTAGEQFVIQTGLLVYLRIVSSLGASAFAAHQIAISVNSMAFSISQAFQISNNSLVGRSVGGDDYDLAERYTIFSRRLARLITGIVAAFFIIFAARIASIYTDDLQVISLAIPVFYLMSLIQYVQSSQMTTAGALKGAGDIMYPLYASILGIWGFRIALAAVFVFVFDWGVTGAWLSFFIDQCGRSFVIKRRFSSGKWREMKSVREERMRLRNEKLQKSTSV